MACDMILFLFAVFNIGYTAANRDYARYFRPNNYIQNLPSLSLGYISDLPIPSMNLPPIVKPTKVMKTKVINIVTKYIYKNPVCVKISGKKSLCQQAKSTPTNLEYTITKEYYVKNNNERTKENDDLKFLPTMIDEKRYEPPGGNDLDLYIEGSEDSRAFSNQIKTPSLSEAEIKELLIEDRLDQLETILPHYTRRRVYETSTVTVTRVKTDNRVTATLLVKNCVPQGYPMCPPKTKKRKSKVAQWTNDTSEFFG